MRCTVFFLKSAPGAPGAFEIEIKLRFSTLYIVDELSFSLSFSGKAYKNAEFDTKRRYSLHISV